MVLYEGIAAFLTVRFRLAEGLNARWLDIALRFSDWH
jgi:hypothetical protein